MSTRGNSAISSARPVGPGGSAAGPKMLQFKLVLLGESAVGKSSLVLRFVKGQFHEYQESTIGGPFPFAFSLLILSLSFSRIYLSCAFLQRPSSHKRWLLTTRPSSSKSGTPPVRSAITASRPCIIGTRYLLRQTGL